jgi:hypothetical protein
MDLRGLKTDYEDSYHPRFRKQEIYDGRAVLDV